ncbi:MAG TPA: sugar phosphate isomerase/epimerase [Roseiflexaceae bacterium]|nr:sugar phosphate isomerase/epimerase [Roseiflexaceae bacterium]
MQIGMFAKTFVRPTLAATLDAVVAQGIGCVQFNMACAGLPSMPERIAPSLLAEIRAALDARRLRVAAVSGTFNMIHPDPARREGGLARLRTLATSCGALGTSVITLSTGTRDPDDMWRRHPDNDAPDAWRDLLVAMSAALAIAEQYGVTLAFEPEVSNVVDTAVKGRRLLDELRSPSLKVVIDGANLFRAGELPRMREVLDEAFVLLGDDIVLAHAKDLRRDGEAGDAAAGTGLLDYDHYLALLRGVGYTGPLILHGLAEGEIAQSVAFLLGKGLRLEAL